MSKIDQESVDVNRQIFDDVTTCCRAPLLIFGIGGYDKWRNKNDDEIR